VRAPADFTLDTRRLTLWKPRAGNDGQFERTPEAAERDAEACRLLRPNGTDETCLAHRHGDIIIQLDRHSKMDATQTTRLVTAALHGKIEPLAVVDVIGVSASVVDQLRATGNLVRESSSDLHCTKQGDTPARRAFKRVTVSAAFSGPG
jgi:hypothetical protein